MNLQQAPSGFAAPGRVRLPLFFSLALREGRAGFSGFYIFVACVALGVMVISAVGAISDSLRSGLERQGEQILGGDVTLSRSHARATPAELAFLRARGLVSEAGIMRTMARSPDGAEQALVELKAVDRAYPLAGEVSLESGGALFDAIGTPGTAAVDPILLDRLGVPLGGTITLGKAQVTIRATIGSEPDGIADRLTYGPRILVTLPTLEETGLVQPGTLLRWRYALKLPADRGDDPAALAAFRAEVARSLPESGFVLADRRDPSPQVTRTVDRLRQFLGLIGLTALLVGGVGVANAVTTFIDRRRKVIATFKSLGATNRTVLAIFLTQVMLMAAVGVAIGLALGYAVPAVVHAIYGDMLPIRTGLVVRLSTIAVACAYGFLVTALFTLWPLGQAELISPAVLFRDEVQEHRPRPRRGILVMTLLIALALLAFAAIRSESPSIALAFCGALAVIFALFMGLGSLVTWGARRVPRPRRPEFALAIGNLGAPGGLTRTVILSLGAGLSLLVAVAVANASLVGELRSRIPARAPNYFVLDLPKDDLAGLTQLVSGLVPGADVESAPMLRGRIVKLNGAAPEDMKVPPEAQWVLAGDRGLSYAAAVPSGSKVVAGEWWPEGYDGPPLVSFERQLAQKLGLKLGDTVTVNVLGRNLAARISNLRELSWDSLAINFVMIFSPNALQAAPHNLLATIALPRTVSLQTEAEVARALGKAYPAVTAVRVKDALNAFTAIFVKIMTAVQIAGGITLVAGALVLAGALATAQRRRILEAVILKTLGATQRRILAAHFAEYLILATVTATLAVVLGTITAWFALTSVMDLKFTLSWWAIAEALALSIVLVLVFGGYGTWRVLRARPVPYLRTA